MIKARENIIDSNIDWLGKVPSDWKVVKLKYALANIPYPIVDGPFGTQLKADEYTESGVPLVRISNLDYKGNLTLDDIRFISAEKALELERSRIRLNDVIIGKTGATIGKSGLNDKIEYGVVSSSCLKVSVDESILAPHFFKYYVTSPNFQNIILQTASGSTRDTINITPMANLEVVLPSLFEQHQIVNFLDYQTAIIDQLIQKKEKLIELLNEKRQSVINEAVTKGLDPDAKMKDSGIEWLGEVPESWELVKFNRYVFLKHGYQFRDYDFTDEGVKIVKITQLKADGSLDVSNASFIDINRISEFKEIIIEEGDILMALTGGTIGKIIKVEKVDEILLQNYRVGKFIPTSNRLSKDFLFWVLSSIQIQYQIFFAQKETGQPNIGKEDFGKMMFVLPPISEQSEIVQFIANSIKKISDLIRLIELEIVKLNDYRQSIISEAVTGKIDVRDWQPSKKQVI